MSYIPKRTLVIIAIEVIAFAMSAALSCIWILNPNVLYEPFLVLTGLIFIATEAYRRYEGRLFHTKSIFRTPSERIHHHDSLRRQFEEEIQRGRQNKLRKEVIIRDVNRLDDYPNSKPTKGISSSFKVGLLDIYHKGIKVGLGWKSLVDEPQGLRKVNYKSGECAQLNAMLIGAIPYDFIVSMNVDGDEYDNFPHVFCHFAHKGEPYERLYYAQEVDMGHGHSYWNEIATYEDIKSNSKGVSEGGI